MANWSEMSKLKSLVRRYRRLTDRLISEGENYTDGEHCCFCSGDPGYLSAEDNDDGNGNATEVRHDRRCPTRQADKLAAVILMQPCRGR